jgi:outer membrane autotransporter protein
MSDDESKRRRVERSSVHLHSSAASARHRLGGIVASLAVLLSAASIPAFANGGNGGEGTATSGSAGSGGTDQPTSSGGTGGFGTNTGGGGGGGGGTNGGTGGQGGNNGTDCCAGVGGGGAPNASVNGGTGIGGSEGGGGGGGGGGAHGFVGTTLPTSSVFGSTGGNAGNGSGAIDRRQNGGGGGGGGGGYGAVVSGSGGTIGVNINGGGGGSGGDGGSAVSPGGVGGQGGTGGVGLQLIGTSSVTLGSGFTITGGTGGAGGFGSTVTGLGGDGGIGINVWGSSAITNNGTINGGSGGVGGRGAAEAAGLGVDIAAAGGNGAIGVSLNNGGSLVNNGTGTITGGTGGVGGQGGNPPGSAGVGGAGGIAALLIGGSSTNSGIINGGTGGQGGTGEQSQGGTGGMGGDGVFLFGTGAQFTNSGTITGGTAGNGGFGQGSNGSGSAGGNGGVGGNGVAVTFGSLTNANTINGGQGGSGVVGPDAVGSGAAGGNGVFASLATVVNTGTITGGTGGNGETGGFHLPPFAGVGGAGGNGVSLIGGSLNNTGTINGGMGGAGGNFGESGGGAGGNGGTGVAVNHGSLTNTGNIYGGTGGPGGSDNGPSGAGGIAVTHNNGTLINSGSIIGGFRAGSGPQADAIAFGNGVNILQLQPGSNIQGVVNANAGNTDTLALGGSGLASFNVGQIGVGQQYQGFESFEKTGAGAWTLTGTTGATGPWVVNQGTLVVNGSLAQSSGLTVNSGGIIGGSGTLPMTMINGGTLSPGNSIGTINMQGNFVHTGGVHQLEIAPGGQGDRVNVAGTATLNGPIVQVIAAQASYANSTTYTILNASGGVSGAYANVAENFAFLTPTLSYDANNAYLTLALQQNAFSSGAVTANQKAVGYALDRSFASASGDFATVIGALAGLDTAQGPAALNSISGQPWADFGTANVASGALFMNTLGQQMALARGVAGTGQRQALAQACDVTTCDDVRPWSAWVSALGGLGSVLGDGNTSAFTYNLGGAAAGLDYRFDPRFLLGLGVGYMHGTQWTNGFMGQGWTNSVSIAAYGSFTQAGFYVDVLAGYAWSSNQLQRQIVIPNLQPRTANGSTGANQFLAQVETGYSIGLDASTRARLAPFARLQIASVTQNAFAESGAGSLSLNVAQQGTNSLRSTIGVDLGGELPLGSASKVAVTLRLGWQHEFDDTTRPISAAFAGAPGNGFTVYGATPVRDSAVIGFNASTAIAEATSLYLRYDGQLGGGTDNHALNVGLRLTW